MPCGPPTMSLLAPIRCCHVECSVPTWQDTVELQPTAATNMRSHARGIKAVSQCSSFFRTKKKKKKVFDNIFKTTFENSKKCIGIFFRRI